MEYFLHNIKVVAVICLLAYLLTKSSSFSRALLMIPTTVDKIFLSILFGVLSIIGNILGVTVFNNVMIQSRFIGPIAGGIIAGPFVGVTAGLIGGIYRYFTPGFIAVPALYSTIIAGIVGGFFYYRFGKNRLTFFKALVAGLIVEIIWNGLVLFLAKPMILAKLLVRMISPTTTIVNPLGIAIFITFVKDIQYGKNLIGANYAEKALEIAKQTLPILKSGLNAKAADRIAEIIYTLTDMHAVAITDTEKILAFKGIGSDHHIPGSPILTSFMRYKVNIESIIDSNIFIANSKQEIGCPVKDCPLDAVAVAPLICNQELIGYIKVYKVGSIINLPDIKMISGIASLLSLELQNARLDEQAKLLAKAEYDALRAQINPHFLFNTLSVIKLLIRTDPNQARELIVNLATFFRKTLNRNEDIIPLIEEINVIRLYVSIQQVRFGERLQVTVDVPKICEKIPFPAFALQPLVENSMNHGLSKKTGLLSIKVLVKIKDNFLVVCVIDNGVGFPNNVLDAVKHDYMHKEMGIGLTNINRRLKSLYGNRYTFSIENISEGAKVIIKVPIIRA